MAEDIRNALPNGTVLGQHYVIEECIGGGGFGIVYRARHVSLDVVYAIKELFPSQLVSREGKLVQPSSISAAGVYEKTLRDFLREAKHLIRLGACPGVVRCHNYFEENQTSYLVMEYVEGESLRDLITAYKAKNGTFEPEIVMSLFKDLLSGLKEVHKAGLLHLNIKPDNVYISRQDEKPILLDFGAARHETGKSVGSGLLVGTRPYAPFEQEHSRGKLGPWTDIYALGVMFYELMFLDRDELPGSLSRMDSIFIEKAGDLLLPAVSRKEGSVYPADFLGLIDRCLSLDKESRPQSAEEVESSLSRESVLPKGSIAPRPRVDPSGNESKSTGESSRRLARLAVLITFLVVLVSGSVMYFWPPPPPAPIIVDRTSPEGLTVVTPPDRIDEWLEQASPEAEFARLFADTAALGIEMVELKGGSFLMGSRGFKSERAVHRVAIKPFAIGKYEVLGFQYRVFETATGRSGARSYGDRGPRCECFLV